MHAVPLMSQVNLTSAASTGRLGTNDTKSAQNTLQFVPTALAQCAEYRNALRRLVHLYFTTPVRGWTVAVRVNSWVDLLE
jgi:hypothetical protein